MPIVIGLADELEQAAGLLGQGYPDRFPRAANLLRVKAEQLRKPKGKRSKARTLKAHVGRGKGKAGDFTIKRERLEK